MLNTAKGWRAGLPIPSVLLTNLAAAVLIPTHRQHSIYRKFLQRQISRVRRQIGGSQKLAVGWRLNKGEQENSRGWETTELVFIFTCASGSLTLLFSRLARLCTKKGDFYPV